ncbi:MAG: 1,4-alpha-glucan branching protein GlgB [Chlamydiia bacterium]|nr:1,4-alpha-glucan branching protein GlgB [Chlamydiia bacterium]
MTPLSIESPHQVLGYHNGTLRLYRPGAEEIFVEIDEQVHAMSKKGDEGLFELKVDHPLSPQDYKIWHVSGLKAHDPYAFPLSLSKKEIDDFLLGRAVSVYKSFGARLMSLKGVFGTRFVVWAPNAQKVSVIGDFNDWDGRVNPLSPHSETGVWELFVPGLKEGERYKFEIVTSEGKLLVKSDPFALQGEARPLNASKVASLEGFYWEDQIWLDRRRRRAKEDKPLSIYEVHLGSWKKKDGRFLTYKELAKSLIEYVKRMGYTHIELMPIQEHPLDESWGYQVSGFFAVTSRFGSPKDFMDFVNRMHMNEIGVILDWVPGHFPTDGFALAGFDGTPLFEHEDPIQKLHPTWETFVFGFEKPAVRSFLINSALFWLEVMHVDGLRVDAVSSMLYLDHERKEGEWTPNEKGGNENLEAISFFKTLNETVHERDTGALMIAEESSSFPKVTHPVQEGGLGFDLKWNMGWMNDTLRYFSEPFEERRRQHKHLTFGRTYAFQERYILALSHDEVVHLKKSLFSKMPGSAWERYANLRLLLSYQFCQPGKKLLFMGGEIGQVQEWDAVGEIPWGLLEDPRHNGIQLLVKELNEFYQVNHALWERDFTEKGFEWVSHRDEAHSVIAYLRKSTTQILLCVHNFSPEAHQGYELPLKGIVMVKEAFSSDKARFGGTGNFHIPPMLLKDKQSIVLQIAPLATEIYHVQFE